LEGPASEQGAQGSHAGQVFVELHDTTIRRVNSHDLIARWRKQTETIAGVESLTFGTLDVGPGGRPIEFKLTAPAKAMDQLIEAVEVAKQTLGEFAGVFDVADDNLPGKWEFQFKMKEQALATGVTPWDLGDAVRNAYFGAEAMRIQRGRHEVKLMVRYPPEERQDLAQFTNMQIQTGDDWQRPLTELAEVKVRRGFSEVNRVDQQRSITVNADVDKASGNTNKIVASINKEFMQVLRDRFPDVSLKWEGQQQQNRESMQSLVIGFFFAMIGMFVLLVLQFNSYFQPLLILLVVPFGMIGAVWGHALLGIPITLFSMFGLVALAGVVVNDSIVLVDFINSRVRSGHSLHSALVECGLRRMRPVLLTSVTTIAGLGPLLLEKSFQAQLLIPMATSLAFGLAATTALVLFIVPLFYLIYARIWSQILRILHSDIQPQIDMDEQLSVVGSEK
jgi:multidrug efflux pump subunit AcrB